MRKIDVCILEDEPLMCKKIFPILFQDISKGSLQFGFRVDCFLDYNSIRNRLIKKSVKGFNYDLAILDVGLVGLDTHTGLDIAILIRKLNPMTKIVFHTSIENRFEVLDIFNAVKPEGFLIKYETDYKSLKKAILEILSGKVYHSKTVMFFIKDSKKLTFELDDFDFKILFELSKGTKTNRLPALLGLSLSGIENRKRKIAFSLGMDTANSDKMVENAKKHKLI